jgi:predicted TIM-barrel fold metal-dependent hydrolase
MKTALGSGRPRVKIDAFAHISPIRYLERVEHILASPGVSPAVREHGPWLRADPVLFDLDARRRALEPFDDYRQVLVLAAPPLEELGSPAVTRELARLANDEMAALVHDRDRFVGFAASLPLNDVDASLVELDRAVADLGALGFQVYSNVNGRPLDDARFAPLFARAAELDVTIWLHPTRSPAWPDYPAEAASLHGIWWSIGWPYETAAAMCRLVYSGVLEAHPGLRIVTHHAGAMIPYFSGRFREIQTEDQRPALERLPHEPLEYFHRFYADTALFGAAHALRCAVEFFGPGHMLFGTDMPLGGPGVVAETIADVELLGLTDADRALVYEGNAREVLRLA